MEWIRDRVLGGENLFGVWLGLGSGFVAEVAGLCGFDWGVIDNEHGLGGDSAMAGQIQGMSNSSCAPIVRVAANRVEYFKWALDLGACGIMVPQVNNARQAFEAVKFMKYPPDGVRGLTRGSRASKYGMEFEDYFAKANDNLLTIVQIETKEAVENAGEIAAVDGVDVLFVGPSDLCLDLGVSWDLEGKEFRGCVEKVLGACRKENKRAGILLKEQGQIEAAVREGFNFVGVGVDLSIVRDGMKTIAEDVRRLK